MLLQTLVFSYMFRFDIPNFPLYLICGNTLFNSLTRARTWYGQCAGQCVAYQKSIRAQVSFFPSAAWCPAFVNLLFSLAAILLVMLITRSPFYWTILLVWAPAFAAAGVLLRHGRAAFGAGGLLPRPAIPVRYPDDGMDVRYTAVLSPPRRCRPSWCPSSS